MTGKSCFSCGLESPQEKIHCIHCGGILAVPPAGSFSGTARLKSSPLVVSKSTTDSGRAPLSSAPGWRVFFSLLFALLRYALGVSLGVVVVLVLLEPKEHTFEAAPIPDASVLVARAIVSARTGTAFLSQQILNEFLRSKGGVHWKSPFRGIPVPVWKGSRVLVLSDHLTFFLDVTFLGYPFHFSESFKLAGIPRNWCLLPESGTVGLLPVSGAPLVLLTKFISVVAKPVLAELRSLAALPALELRPGFVEFSGP